jgi:hypothetical protein
MMTRSVAWLELPTAHVKAAPTRILSQALITSLLRCCGFPMMIEVAGSNIEATSVSAAPESSYHLAPCIAAGRVT